MKNQNKKCWFSSWNSPSCYLWCLCLSKHENSSNFISWRYEYLKIVIIQRLVLFWFGVFSFSTEALNSTHFPCIWSGHLQEIPAKYHDNSTLANTTCELRLRFQMHGLLPHFSKLNWLNDEYRIRPHAHKNRVFCGYENLTAANLTQREKSMMYEKAFYFLRPIVFGILMKFGKCSLKFVSHQFINIWITPKNGEKLHVFFSNVISTLVLNIIWM